MTGTLQSTLRDAEEVSIHRHDILNTNQSNQNDSIQFSQPLRGLAHLENSQEDIRESRARGVGQKMNLFMKGRDSKGSNSVPRRELFPQNDHTISNSSKLGTFTGVAFESADRTGPIRREFDFTSRARNEGTSPYRN